MQLECVRSSGGAHRDRAVRGCPDLCLPTLYYASLLPSKSILELEDSKSSKNLRGKERSPKGRERREQVADRQEETCEGRPAAGRALCSVVRVCGCMKHAGALPEPGAVQFESGLGGSCAP
eukprot:140490-Chlamydomonas_euryale.AAC.6